MSETEEKLDTILKLLIEHHELGMKELRRLMRKNVSMEREIRILHQIVAKTEQTEFPWFSLPSAKMRQVERVIDYLREHPTAKLTLACQRVFTPCEGNYPNVASLQTYCYKHRIWVFAKHTLEADEG